MNSLLIAQGINPAWLPLGLLVLFVGVAFFLSLAGGWRDLARRFPAPAQVAGERLHFCSVFMQKSRIPANYSYCVTVGLNESGLYLRMSVFFRFAHAPLFIPWQWIERVEQQKHWFGTLVTVSPKGTPVRIHLRGRAGREALRYWSQRGTL